MFYHSTTILYYATVLHHSSNIAYHATQLSYCCTFNLVMGLIKTQNSYILLTPLSTLWCPSMYLILLLIVVTGSEPVITTAGHLTLMSGWHSVLINQIRLVQEMPLFSGYCQHACRRKFKGKWSKKNKLDRKGGTERERTGGEASWDSRWDPTRAASAEETMTETQRWNSSNQTPCCIKDRPNKITWIPPLFPLSPADLEAAVAGAVIDFKEITRHFPLSKNHPLRSNRKHPALSASKTQRGRERGREIAGEKIQIY